MGLTSSVGSIYVMFTPAVESFNGHKTERVKPNEGFYCLTCTKSWCTWFTFWFIIHSDGHWQLEHSNQEPRRACSLNWLLMESREVVCAARRMTTDYQAARDLLQLFRGSEAFLHKTLLDFWPRFILYNIILDFVCESAQNKACVSVCPSTWGRASK